MTIITEIVYFEDINQHVKLNLFVLILASLAIQLSHKNKLKLICILLEVRHPWPIQIMDQVHYLYANFNIATKLIFVTD